MSHPAEFPNELLDRIISFLPDDRTSLANFSLVCRGWLPASRRHLFHSVKLYYSTNAMARGHAWNTNSFVRLLGNAHNTIAPFIRDARVDVWTPFLPDLFGALGRAGVSLSRLEKIISSDNFQDSFDSLNLLGQQKDLRELRMTYDGTFSLMGRPFAPLLQFCSFFPSIRSLTFSVLHVNRVKNVCGIVPTSPLPNRIPLDSLCVSCSDNGEALEWFGENVLSPGYPRSLSLVAWLYDHDGCGPVTKINSFLNELGGGLRELKISVEYAGEYGSDSIGPAFTHIDLRSSINLQFFSADIHDIWSIYDTLCSLPETVNLEICSINVAYRGRSPRSYQPCRNMESDVWRRLGRLRCLQRCCLVVTVPQNCLVKELAMLNDALSGRSYVLKLDGQVMESEHTLVCSE